MLMLAFSITGNGNLKAMDAQSTGQCLLRRLLMTLSFLNWKVCDTSHLDPKITKFICTVIGTAVYIIADCSENAAPFSPAVDGVILAHNITGGCLTRDVTPFWGAVGLTSGKNHTLNVTLEQGYNVTFNFGLDALMCVPFRHTFLDILILSVDIQA